MLSSSLGIEFYNLVGLVGEVIDDEGALAIEPAPQLSRVYYRGGPFPAGVQLVEVTIDDEVEVLCSDAGLEEVGFVKEENILPLIFQAVRRAMELAEGGYPLLQTELLPIVIAENPHKPPAFDSGKLREGEGGDKISRMKDQLYPPAVEDGGGFLDFCQVIVAVGYNSQQHNLSPLL